MLIREIQKQDNPQIANVIRTVFIEDDFPKTGTAFEDKQLDFMFESYEKSKAVYFVVENNGKIVGGAGVSKLAATEENICELQKMYILNEARGNGLGNKLIQLCLDKAKEFGYEKCYLETLPTMKVAQHLYQKLGFEYLDKQLGNTCHTSCHVWMIKDL